MATDLALRIVVADDDVAAREALAPMLQRAAHTIVTETHDSTEALRLTRLNQPDVAVIGFGPPEVFRVLQAFGSEELRSVRALVLYRAQDRASAFRAIQLGARGVLSKPAGEALLSQSLRAVSRGSYFVDEQELPDHSSALRTYADLPDYHVALYGLTPREMEIISYIGRGAPNKDIAAFCGIAPDTVKHHLSSIFTKVGVSSRLELALFAVRHKMAAGT